MLLAIAGNQRLTPPPFVMLQAVAGNQRLDPLMVLAVAGNQNVRAKENSFRCQRM